MSGTLKMDSEFTLKNWKIKSDRELESQRLVFIWAVPWNPIFSIESSLNKKGGGVVGNLPWATPLMHTFRQRQGDELGEVSEWTLKLPEKTQDRIWLFMMPVYQQVFMPLRLIPASPREWHAYSSSLKPPLLDTGVFWGLVVFRTLVDTK